MSSISRFTGKAVAGFAIGWIVAVILLFVALDMASARLALRATGGDAVAAIGFPVGPMTWFILFGPPLALAAVWRRVRRSGVEDATE